MTRNWFILVFNSIRIKNKKQNTDRFKTNTNTSSELQTLPTDYNYKCKWKRGNLKYYEAISGTVNLKPLGTVAAGMRRQWERWEEEKWQKGQPA